MATTPAFASTPKITPQSFVNADGTGKKTVVTAGSSGTKVTGLVATSTDTSTRIAQVWLTRSGTSYLLGSVSVTTLAGTDGAVNTIDLFSTIPLPTDNDRRKYLFLVSGDTLQVSFTVAVTAAKEIDILAIHGDL